MLTVYFKTIRDFDFKQITDFRAGCWIHVNNATMDDLDKIAALTSIPIEEFSDSLDAQEIPRIEYRENKAIIFTRHPTLQEGDGLHTLTLTIILTETFTITISPQTSEIISEILHTRPNLATTQKSKFFFYILLRISSLFTNRIKKVRNIILEYGQTMKAVENETIILFAKNEEILNQYLGSLVAMRNLMQSLASGRYVSLYEQDYDLIEDLTIAINQSEDLCRVNIKSIRSLRDAYQIVFTNNVNKMIKKLTAITIIFTVPTIIASVYGMNVVLPLAEFSSAIYYILGIILMAILALTFVFWKKKWL